MTARVKVIAEAELNHNGDVGLAKRMVEAAKAAGADFVKFQAYRTEAFLAPSSPQHSIFAPAELRAEAFAEIKAHAEYHSIPMIATAIDFEGLATILALDLPAIKIDSTNITNLPMLQAIAETGKPVYLSTGASTLDEVAEAVAILRNRVPELVLLHCTVQYPADSTNLNLRAIGTMQVAFPGIAVGYSDHTPGPNLLAAAAAVALGAVLLEKHFTLDNTLPGPDHGFSANPEALATYVRAAHEVTSMLGDGRKVPQPIEARAQLRARRYITALRDISTGATIEAHWIRSRRVAPEMAESGSLLSPQFEDQIIGRRTVRSISSGSPVRLRDLEQS